VLRVHHFTGLRRGGSAHALTAELTQLVREDAFARRAWVTLWDVRSTHRYLQLPESRLGNIHQQSIEHGAEVLGIPAGDVRVAIAISRTEDVPGKAQVSLFAASSADIAARLRPIIDAGFSVEGVCTPCGALWAQARLRRPSIPGEVHAYVALAATQAAFVIVRDGFLLHAREMPWGYAESPLAPSRVVSRNEIAARLAPELRRGFLYVKQFCETEVSQVLLCGDMPELRSLTAPLIERLNIEVEMLDTLDGIDATALPQPSDQFADQVASLRLAAAIAAEPPIVNLLQLPAASKTVSRARTRAIVVGAAAAVAVAAFLHARADLRSSATEAHRIALIGAKPRPQQQTPAPRVAAIQPSLSSQPAVPPHVVSSTAAPVERQTAVRQPAAHQVVRNERARSRRSPVAPAEQERAPVVRTILYSPAIRVAVVDEQIVRTGDKVAGGTVQAIERDAILFQTPTGRLLRVPLTSGS
jgi:Tfp pilus assembly PilM family ATPase